jgi:hypothetical protein
METFSNEASWCFLHVDLQLPFFGHVLLSTVVRFACVDEKQAGQPCMNPYVL